MSDICKHDTDNDGDCQYCHFLGGCPIAIGKANDEKIEKLGAELRLRKWAIDKDIKKHEDYYEKMEQFKSDFLEIEALINSGTFLEWTEIRTKIKSLKERLNE